MTVSSQKREQLKVAVEQLKDRVELVDERFLDWVCDEVASDEVRREAFEGGPETAEQRIYHRVMDLRPDQLVAVVTAWTRQMSAELERWDGYERIAKSVQELQENAEKRALTREDAGPPVVLADAQGPYICGACDGTGTLYDPDSDGDQWTTCDACEGSGDVA